MINEREIFIVFCDTNGTLILNSYSNICRQIFPYLYTDDYNNDTEIINVQNLLPKIQMTIADKRFVLEKQNSNSEEKGTQDALKNPEDTMQFHQSSYLNEAIESISQRQSFDIGECIVSIGGIFIVDRYPSDEFSRINIDTIQRLIKSLDSLYYNNVWLKSSEYLLNGYARSTYETNNDTNGTCPKLSCQKKNRNPFNLKGIDINPDMYCTKITKIAFDQANAEFLKTGTIQSSNKIKIGNRFTRIRLFVPAVDPFYVNDISKTLKLLVLYDNIEYKPV